MKRRTFARAGTGAAVWALGGLGARFAAAGTPLAPGPATAGTLAAGVSPAAGTVDPSSADANPTASSGSPSIESAIALATPTGTIAGTLSLPAGGAPMPVVLIVAGSGPTDRDGNSSALPGKNDTYKLLAEALAARSIASVRYDKRGIAGSAAAGGPESGVRFDTFVNDAAAWLRRLNGDARFSRVVVAGHSEGSLVGMIAMQRAPAAAFVSLEGAGRPAATILRAQLEPKLPPDQYAVADAILTRLQAGHTAPLPSDAPAYMRALFRDSIQPYLISWFRYDPAIELGKLSVPVTIVQGTADVQVTIADARALAQADPSARVVIVRGMNHLLRNAPDTSSQAAILAGYDDPSLPIEPKVVDAVAAAADTDER